MYSVGRLVGLLPAVLVLILASPVCAQAWIEFADYDEFFRINFPEQPAVESVEWISEDDLPLPARQYSASRGNSRYIVTVIDFREARRATLLGAIAHAATHYRQRGEVTYDAFSQVDRISGHQLQITDPAGRRMFVAIYLHEDRLYVLEANVPPRSAPPGQFQQSLEILDEDGKRIRYALDGTKMIRADELPPQFADRIFLQEDGFVNPNQPLE